MRNILFSLLFLPALMEAETIDVNKIRLAGPYPIAKPFMTDSLDTEGKKIDLDEVYLESLTPDPSPRRGEILTKSTEGGFFLPSPRRVVGGEAVYLASFTIQNTGFAKGKVNVKCESKHKLYIDGDEQGGEFELVPGRHEVCIKLLVKPSPNAQRARSKEQGARGRRIPRHHSILLLLAPCPLPL